MEYQKSYSRLGNIDIFIKSDSSSMSSLYPLLLAEVVDIFLGQELISEAPIIIGDEGDLPEDGLFIFILMWSLFKDLWPLNTG